MIRNEKKYLIIIVILIAVNLFLFSGISPLHSIYNMQYDEWIFYLIGKGMVNGKVPYLDLADHKGPYLFYLFALMNLMPSNHLGLFIVSTIIYAVIGIFVFKISCLILSARTARAYGTDELCESTGEAIRMGAPLFVALVIHFMLSSYYLSFGTITSEIITLPFTLSSYYLFLKYLYSGEVKHRALYMMSYGICAGIVFFIKANAVLAYVPIAIYLLVFLTKKKGYKNLLHNALVGLAAFIIAIMPAVIYSIVTGSLKDMIEWAFITNFVYVGGGLPGAESVFESLYDTVMKFKEYTILCIFSIPALYYLCARKARAYGTDGEALRVRTRMGETVQWTVSHYEPIHMMCFYILSLVINLYSVYMSYRPYTNYLSYLIFYFIPLILFFADGLSAIAHQIWKKKFIHLLLLIISIVFINMLSYSFLYEMSDNNGIIQRTLSKRIVDMYKGSDYYRRKPKVLVVGLPLYLYEAFGVEPNEKYFATPVMLRESNPTPYDALIDKIDSGVEDVVIVSYSNIPMGKDLEFQNILHEALADNYISIGSTKYLNREAEVFVKNDK